MSQVRLQFGWNGVVDTGIKRLPRLDTALRPSKIVLDDKLVEQSELITVSNVPNLLGVTVLNGASFGRQLPPPFYEIDPAVITDQEVQTSLCVTETVVPGYPPSVSTVASS